MVFDLISFALGAVTAVSSTAVYAWVKSKITAAEAAAAKVVAKV